MVHHTEAVRNQSTTKTDILHDFGRLYIARDLGGDCWQLGISDGGKTIREVTVDRRDIDAGKAEFLAEVGKARERFGLTREVERRDARLRVKGKLIVLRAVLAARANIVGQGAAFSQGRQLVVGVKD
jgi:hypothetical protein